MIIMMKFFLISTVFMIVKCGPMKVGEFQLKNDQIQPQLAEDVADNVKNGESML